MERAPILTVVPYSGAWDATKSNCRDITLDKARMALQQFDPRWDELFPAKRTRIIAMVVKRVDIGVEGISVRMRNDGFAELAQEQLQSPEVKDAAA